MEGKAAVEGRVPGEGKASAPPPPPEAVRWTLSPLHGYLELPPVMVGETVRGWRRGIGRRLWFPYDSRSPPEATGGPCSFQYMLSFHRLDLRTTLLLMLLAVRQGSSQDARAAYRKLVNSKELPRCTDAPLALCRRAVLRPRRLPSPQGWARRVLMDGMVRITAEPGRAATPTVSRRPRQSSSTLVLY